MLPPGGIRPAPLSARRWMGRVGPAGATSARNLDSINWQSKTPNLIYLLHAANACCYDADSLLPLREGLFIGCKAWQSERLVGPLGRQQNRYSRGLIRLHTDKQLNLRLRWVIELLRRDGGAEGEKKEGERCYSTQECSSLGLRLGTVSIKSEKGYHIIEFVRWENNRRAAVCPHCSIN